MSASVPHIDGPGTATALTSLVAIYTAGNPAHLSDKWRGLFLGFALVSLGATLLIERLHS